MLTKLKIRNFKTFDDVEIELGQNVVFIGPNNSGKTTALQALMLWYEAGNRWAMQLDSYKTSGVPLPERLTINRLSLNAIPILETPLLWHNLKTVNSKAVELKIIVDGISDDIKWSSGYTFHYANDESIDCFADNLRDVEAFFDEVPYTTFLPPMSGLNAVEDQLQPGAVNRRIGEGRTAEVLRNICYNVYEKIKYWQRLVNHMRQMFGVEILPPQYLAVTGEIRMSYKEVSGIELDISAAGRGMLQMLLLVAYLYEHPGAVLLLDEPDAHLEILRQREVYQLLTNITREMGSQLIIATHSEVIMNEAGEQDMLIAFVGKPHRIDDRNSRSQVLKALREIRFDDYYQAIQTGWVLYLEDSTDLRILQQFAQTLKHGRAIVALERPFVWYVKTNHPPKAREHFFALREAKPDLGGLCLFDRLEREPSENEYLKTLMWRKREIENYLCLPETLLAYAQQFPDGETAMQAEIAKLESAFQVLNRPSIFSPDVKASDDVLVPLFKNFFASLGQYNVMEKSNFHVLAQYVPVDKIDPEVIEKLDAIVKVAENAKPGDAS